MVRRPARTEFLSFRITAGIYLLYDMAEYKSIVLK